MRLLFLKILIPLNNATKAIVIISTLMQYDMIDINVNCFNLNIKIKLSKITDASFLTF